MGLESGSHLRVRGSRNTVRERELDVVVVELSSVFSSAIRRINFLDTNDLNASITSSVTGSHLGVELVNGSGQRRIAELFVHIMSTTATVVSEPHTVILNIRSLLLEDLVDSKNLSSGLLQLVDLMKEIPKSGFRSDGIRGEHSHSVNFGIRILLRWDFTSNNLKIFLLYKKVL